MAVQTGIQVGSSPCRNSIGLQILLKLCFWSSLLNFSWVDDFVWLILNYVASVATCLYQVSNLKFKLQQCWTWLWVLIIAPSFGQSVPVLVSKQWVTKTVCVPNWGESSQTVLELFRLNKEPQTSVSHSTAAASPPVLQHAVLLLLCMSDVPLLGPRGVSPHIF